MTAHDREEARESRPDGPPTVMYGRWVARLERISDGMTFAATGATAMKTLAALARYLAPPVTNNEAQDWLLAQHNVDRLAAAYDATAPEPPCDCGPYAPCPKHDEPAPTPVADSLDGRTASEEFADRWASRGWNVSVRLYAPYGPDDDQPAPEVDVWRTALPFDPERLSASPEKEPDR